LIDKSGKIKLADSCLQIWAQNLTIKIIHATGVPLPLQLNLSPQNKNAEIPNKTKSNFQSSHYLIYPQNFISNFEILSWLPTKTRPGKFLNFFACKIPNHFLRVDLNPRILKICASWMSVWNISANYALVPVKFNRTEIFENHSWSLHLLISAGKGLGTRWSCSFDFIHFHW
jgi:hypothetical protein